MVYFIEMYGSVLLCFPNKIVHFLLYSQMFQCFFKCISLLVEKSSVTNRNLLIRSLIENITCMF